MIDIRFLKETIRSIPVLGDVFRQLYILVLGSSGIVDYLRYVKYSKFGNEWASYRLADGTIEFRCSTVLETRRATAALQSERPLIETMQSLCKPDMTVFDVGGNVGTHALSLASVADEAGTIVCFEPHPKTYDALIANVQRNDPSNIITEQIALGETTRTAELFVKDDRAGVGSHSLIQRSPDYRTVVDISVVKGDEYVLENGLDPELVKIDVEGGEMNVLNGLENTLRTSKPTLIVEVHDITDSSQLRALLESYDYEIERSRIEKDVLIAT